MSERHRYRKKPDSTVVAIRLDLETKGFSYEKWGGQQYCKAGDWLVDNEGDVYSVDADVFARTYKEVSPGNFVKVTPIWAEVATEPGSIKTKEGESRYAAGDYLVYNNEDGTDAYCVTKRKFDEMYERDD